MTAVKAFRQRDVRHIADTESVDFPSGTLAVGQFQFNPNFYGQTSSFRLTATMSTSKGAITGSVQLYNLTDGETVTNGLLQTSSTTPGLLFSPALTVGSAPGDLQDTSKLYEARISVTGVDVTDILSVGSVTIRVS
jgi:hypothetical protein